MNRTVNATVIRTELVGGRTSYDVYLPMSAKRYRPIAAGCYATEVHRGRGRYYQVSDFYRTPALDALPAYTTERWNAFKRLTRATDRLALRIAKRVFPELANRRERLPLLWTSYTLPSATKRVPIVVNDRYTA